MAERSAAMLVVFIMTPARFSLMIGSTALIMSTGPNTLVQNSSFTASSSPSSTDER